MFSIGGSLVSVDGMANGVAKEIEEALVVREGVALNGSRYTRSLLEACRSLSSRSISWHTQNITSLEHLLSLARGEEKQEEGEVAAVVVAAGAAAVLLPELQKLPITPVRAQNIIFEQTEKGKADGAGGELELPVISSRYVVPFDREEDEAGHRRYLVAGASQENDNVWEREADLATALHLIERDIVALYPPLSPEVGQWSPVAARAGVKGVAANILKSHY
jgi:glycine/D-amino acid oxidase-like deaminating enzyme